MTINTDASGNLTSLVDYNSDGSHTEYSYDQSGRLTEQNSVNADGSSSDTTYTYDPDGNQQPNVTINSDESGNLTSVVDYNGDGSRVEYSYDQSGQLAEQNTINADGSSIDTTYTYDSDGNQHASVTVDTDASGVMTSLDDYNPDGSYIRYNYDPSSGEATGEQSFGSDGSALGPVGGGDTGGWWADEQSGDEGSSGGGGSEFGGGGSGSGGDGQGGGNGGSGSGGPSNPPFEDRHHGPGDPRDPLVVQLSGGNPDLTALSTSTTHFDFDGNGFAVQTGWIGRTAAFLVQMFGNSASMFGVRSGDGLGDLARLDANGDGRIDTLDTAFANLRLWHDANSNGAVDTGELETLAGAGIAGIGLSVQTVGQSINGNTVSGQATIDLTNGGHGSLSEVDFATNYVHSAYTPPANFSYDPATATLPELKGYGLVPDLRVAMSLDPTLLTMVKGLVAGASSMTADAFNAAFENVLHAWAGAGNVDPMSQGFWVDARHYAVVLKFYGIDPSGTNNYTQFRPNWRNGPIDEEIYRDIFNEMKIRFAIQTTASQTRNGAAPASLAHDPFLPFSTIGYSVTTDALHGNINTLVGAIVHGAPADPTRAGAYYDQTLNLLESLRLDVFRNDNAAFARAFVAAAEKAGMPRDVELRFLSQQLGLSVADEGTASGALFVPAAVVFLGSGDKLISANASLYVYGPTGGNDTLSSSASAALVMSGIASGDVVFERPGGGSDLIIVSKATGSALTIAGYFAGSPLATISFSDGATLTPNDADKALFIEAVHTIVAGAGSGASVAALAPQLALYGIASSVDGGNTGTLVQGTGQSEAIFIGQGDKTASGGGGSDLYVYGSGDGDDVIDDRGNRSKLAFSDIAASDVALWRNGSASGDLVMTVRSTGKTVTIKGEFSAGNAGSMASIAFADGTVWDTATILKETLRQSPFKNGILSYGKASGAVVVRSEAGGTLKLGAGITAADLGFQADATGALTIYTGGAGDSLTLKNDLARQWWGGVASQVGQIAFADGTTMALTRHDYDALTFTWTGTADHTMLTAAASVATSSTLGREATR